MARKRRCPAILKLKVSFSGGEIQSKKAISELFHTQRDAISPLGDGGDRLGARDAAAGGHEGLDPLLRHRGFRQRGPDVPAPWRREDTTSAIYYVDIMILLHYVCYMIYYM